MHNNKEQGVGFVLIELSMHQNKIIMNCHFDHVYNNKISIYLKTRFLSFVLRIYDHLANYR